MNVIVQASSRSWSGSTDSCMNMVDGFPVIHWTLKMLIEHFPDAQIVIVAPQFDADGGLADVAREVSDKIHLIFAHDDSPLERMLEAHSAYLSDSPYVVRLDALNMLARPQDIANIYESAVGGSYDCVKFPDDFPIQFTCDVYRFDALERVQTLIPEHSPFGVHPKYFMFSNPAFKTKFYTESSVSDEELTAGRLKFTQVYVERDEQSKNALAAGDQLSFHNELARSYIQSTDRVLDIACGTGFGLPMLAQVAAEVCGADLEPAAVKQAKEKTAGLHNVSVVIADATKLPFADSSFDVITSFETVEHVSAAHYVREMWRVLAPNGKLIVSTPQNSRGTIPVNPHHVHEYSLSDFKDIFADQFTCTDLIGIKQGTVVIPGDPLGTNTFAVLSKKNPHAA